MKKMAQKGFVKGVVEKLQACGAAVLELKPGGVVPGDIITAAQKAGVEVNYANVGGRDIFAVSR